MITDSSELEILKSQLAGRMRLVRKSSDVSQDEAANICGVSPRSYKDYELAHRSIPIEVLVRFCAGFKVSADKLFFGSSASSNPEGQEDGVAKEIISGVLSVFGKSDDSSEIEKQVKLAEYAWQSARAKKRNFSDELEEIAGLMG